MAKVTFITPDGEHVSVENATGSLMEIATYNDVDGIDASCGGVCSCGTCHVRIAKEWIQQVGTPNESEKEMLDLEDEAGEGSRLSCQVEVDDSMDGLVVEVVPLS